MEDLLDLSEDGTIQYQSLTPKYLEEVLQVTNEVLFLSGNVCKILHVPEDAEALAEINQVPLIAAKDGISVIAVDRKTDRVAGVALNKFLLKSPRFFESVVAKVTTLKARQWLDFLNSTHQLYDVFEECNVNCAMQILFLSVRPEYRKRGIAKKLCELSVAQAQKLRNGINVKRSVDGISVPDLEPVPELVYAMFTSFISKKIGRDLGFEIGSERSMAKVEILGEVFENPDVDTPVMTMEYKMLHRKDD